MNEGWVQNDGLGQAMIETNNILVRWFKYAHGNIGIVLGLGSANERRRYNVMKSLIGSAHIENNHLSDDCSYWQTRSNIDKSRLDFFIPL